MRKVLGSMMLCLLAMVGTTRAESVLYQNNFDSGTEGQSISAEGWTNADTILYSSGAALRVVPQFDTTGLSSELAFSHLLQPGEVVTLQAELWGSNHADVAIGLRTTNDLYRAITRVPGNACLSTIGYNHAVQVNSLGGLNNLKITYRITLTQNTVSFEMMPSGGSWMPLGSAAINETAITHIVLGSAFGLGTNPLYYGSGFRWDNITLTSSITTLYQNNFSSGTEGQSISTEGWTNATKIVYSSGTAYRNAPAGDTESLISDLALSHALVAGETVTLQADVVGASNPDVGIGITTAAGNTYQVFTRVNGKALLSVANYNTTVYSEDLSPASSWLNLNGYVIGYRIHLSQNQVSFEGKLNGVDCTWSGWSPLGSVDVNETAISGIQLRHAFPDGTNVNGTYFKWDNIQLISVVKTVAPVFAPSVKYVSGPTEITMTCPTVGSSIYYTTNGDTPTATQTATNFLYDVNTPVVVNGGTISTLKAIAVSSSLPDSEITSRTYIYSPERVDLTRGHYLLIEKGLQLQAWAFPATFGSFNLTNWYLSKFTTLNTVWTPYSDMTYLPAAPGIPWSRLLATPGYRDITSSEVPFASNLVSLQLSDEQPLTPEIISELASIMSELRTKRPDVIIHANQAGQGSAQPTVAELQSYMQTAQPDMLMFDTYPFNGNLTGGSPTALYNVMQKYRLLGLAGNDGTYAHPIPCALYTQTFTGEGWYHVTSESEIRLNQFAAWSFGYKFISDFLYGNPNYKDTNTTLFSNNGRDDSPTAIFYQVAETNRQSRNLGLALVRLLSTDVRMVMGQHGSGTANTLPSGITAGLSGVDSYLTDASATNLGSKNNGKRGDVIVGFFKPLHEAFDGSQYSNEKYFMVTNGLSDASGSASETQQRIRLTFNMGSNNITSLQRLSRTAGTIEIVPLVSDGGGVYHLDLVLDGGTGDLFKYNTGAPFVGIEEVQAPSLVISPETQTVAKEAGSTSFTVSNGGTGSMAWSAQVTSGGSWLTITSGASGADNGSVVVSFTKNTVPETSRTATVQITANGAAGSPRTVTVVQSAPALISGDANRDGAVDVGDLGILAANYGGSNKTWAEGDFNGDKLVDVGDLGILAANYGSSNFSSDYAQAFDTTVTKEDADAEVTGSSLCGGLGLPLIAGLALMGLMLVKLEE
jgi:hypothetical protein